MQFEIRTFEPYTFSVQIAFASIKRQEQDPYRLTLAKIIVLGS